MPSVNIYIECNITGIKPGNGKIVVVIEFVASNGKTATKNLFKDVTNCTVKEAVLLGLIYAIQQLNKPCEVFVYISDRYVYETLQNNRIETWKENNWMNAKGKLVAYKELWQQYDKVSAYHQVWACFNVHHSYMDWMRAQFI